MNIPAFTSKGHGDTAIVMLHGIGGGNAAWAGQLDFFAARGYRAVAWDQPGYGGSSSVEPYSFEAMAASLNTLVEALAKDSKRVVLVGHSMGGMVAQEFQARHPHPAVRALVLAFTSAAFGGSSSDFATQFIKARIAPLDEGRTMTEIAARLMPAMRGAKSDPAGLATAERTMAGVPPETYRKAVAMLTTFDRRASLPAIAIPVLVLAGSDDKTAPAATMERMAQKIPGAEYRCLNGCGHLGPMDCPEAFNAALLEFFERKLQE